MLNDIYNYYSVLKTKLIFYNIYFKTLTII